MTPIGPQAATAVPAERTMATEQMNRDRAIDAPSAGAPPSPSASGFSGRAVGMASTVAISANGAMSRTTDMSRPASEPTTQKRNWSSVWLSVNRIDVVNAVNNAAGAMPASARRTGAAEWRPMLPSPYTSTEATAAPANANQMNPDAVVTPNSWMPMTTARAAPAS